jgi:hypothetical protein
MSGDRFFYPNPLACDGRSKFNQGELGRSPWFDCSCCPVNIVRFVPSIAGYVYASQERSVYVNLYVGGMGEVAVGDTLVTVRQQTNYPWDGRVRIRVEVPRPTDFALHVRIPGWARGKPMPGDLYQYLPQSESPYSLFINGQSLSGVPIVKGYAVLQRNWDSGDLVELDLPMPIRTVVADESVAANRGRVALERGPLVYCCEAVDNGGTIRDLVLPTDDELSPERRADLLGGITVITGPGRKAERQSDGSITFTLVTVTAIPYSAWAHREMGEMAVWLARDEKLARIQPLSTTASASRASASHVWSSDTVDALNDQVEPTSSIDHDIPRHTWWDHRGTREWVQYDFDDPRTVRGFEVYWFDDTGLGHCRLPKSWRVLYRLDDEWQPVENRDEYGLLKDQFNRVRIAPVKTDGLRLEVELQDRFSGGILEWRVD